MDYFKKVCKFLHSYEELKIYRKNLQLDLSLLSEMNDIKGINYDRLSIKVYDVVKVVENQAIKKIEIETNILQEIHSTSTSIAKIENSLACLTDEECKVVSMIFFQRKNQTEVALKMNFSSKHIGRIKNRAIYKLSNALYGTDLKVDKP
ncbi:MAG: sigma factor-like helix-turn-helix DNA-binding protein [Paraclostridium sp.]